MKSRSFHIGDVVFDPDLRKLSYKDGRSAQLRNKSKEVLVHLLESRNCTLSKANILNAVWSDVTVSDESLVQCIADIRRIVGKDAHQIVETVPRKGYRINIAEAQTGRRTRVLTVTSLATFAGLAAAGVFHWAVPDVPLQQASHSNDTEIAQLPPGTKSKEAYLEVLLGQVSANRMNLDESLIAERHFRRAIELDQNYARAYGELGTLLAVRFENDWTVLADADKQKALYYAQQAVALDPEMWLAHYALGRLYSVFADFDSAETHLAKAMSLQPENEDARAYFGVVRTFKGDSDSAAAILQQAITSHPNPPFWYYYALGHAQFNLRRYVEAQEALLTCLELSPDSPYCLRYLLGVYGATGNRAKAETAALDYASMGFDASVSSILDLMPFHHPDDLAQLEWALHQSGLAD